MLRYQLKSIRLVWRYAPAQALLTFLVYLISAVDMPLMLQYMSNTVNILTRVLEGKADLGAAWLDIVLFALLYILAKISLPVRNLMRVSTDRRLMHSLAEAIMSKLSRLPYSAFEDPELHDTLNIMSDKPWERFGEHFFATMNSLLYLSFILGVCLVIGGINPWLSLAVLALMVPYVYLRNREGSLYNRLYERQSGEERKLKYYADLLSGKDSLYELKLFGSVKYILARRWRCWESTAPARPR